VFVIGFPGTEVTKEQVMISAWAFTQSDQVVRVKLQLRIKVEWFDMVDLQPSAFVATSHTGRLAESVLLLDSRPLGAAFMSMLSSSVCPMNESL
jgi:hypothetical protein